MKYGVMRNPCNITSNDKLWCIVGQSEVYGSGVLAWCYDEVHAKLWYELMKDAPDFIKISYEKWSKYE